VRHKLFASCLLILVSAAVLFGPHLSTVEAGGSGVWSAAASLITGREEHTATLLRNGTILVAGGTDGRGKALANAELYNPKTNRWAPAGTMATTRIDHTATLLPNGEVLVAGGLDAPFPSSALASAEFYDPITNAWSPAAPMSTGRARHTATPLPDGRILVVGGLSVTLRNGSYFPSQPVSAEIYNPRTSGWSATAPMSLYRLDQTATLLRDGRVLVTGGQDGLMTVSSAEIYDPGQDRWSAAASMTTGRIAHAATLLSNGDVLVSGGVSRAAPSVQSSAAEVYDPRVDRWSPVSSMAATRIGHTATQLSNGKVLVVGNTGDTGQSRAEVYDPPRNVWSPVSGSMNRYRHTATRLSDGRILVIGGYGIESLNSVLLYDPSATPPVPRAPTNPLVVAGLLLAAFLVLTAAALSIPNVRRRLRASARAPKSEEWIT
jgi:N-acetylneuraminic acid mutarotase